MGGARALRFAERLRLSSTYSVAGGWTMAWSTSRPAHAHARPSTSKFDPTGYVLTDPSGTQYVLSVADGLVEFIDPQGNSTVYSDAGITPDVGEGVVFVRGGAGRIETMILARQLGHPIRLRHRRRLGGSGGRRSQHHGIRL